MIVALYPDDPHEIREHAHGRFRTMDFCCDRQLLRARRLHVDRLARPPAKTAGGLDRRLCVRQRVSDGLMFDNEVNAASPFAAGETQRELKRCPHQRHRENSDHSGSASEASSSQGQTAANAPKHVIAWYADPFKSEHRQKVGTMSHRIDRTLEYKARCG